MTKKTMSAHKLDGYLPDATKSPGERWITMTNALTRASHGLTLAEKRIVMCAVSKLDSRKPLPPGTVPVTRITAEEYAEAFNLDATTSYEQLRAASKNLYKRSVTFYEPAFKRNGQPLEPTLVNMRWVGQVKYQRGEGWCELHWWPALLPQLTGIKRQFTKYQLEQGSALRSAYSWKLLELLSRFRSTGWAEYTIEDFCTSMEATDKMRENFGKIRTKIIEPAVLELVTKDGWIIEWKAVKAGRKVTRLRFDFKRDPQGQLAL